MSNKEVVIQLLLNEGIDIRIVIREMFMGYKQRKQRKQLYCEDNTIPTTLIKMYYAMNPDEADFEKMKKGFVTRYITNESKLEGVHSPEEIDGLREMYDYISSADIDYMFNVFTLKELHEKLYSKTEYPYFGGTFRNSDAYIKGFPSDLVSHTMIYSELRKLDDTAVFLHDMAPIVKSSGDSNMLLEYMDNVVLLGCELIRIHPFGDGNGRSVRGFMNKLFEDAGLPPVYIKANEKEEYRIAMGKAIGDGDFETIKNFYRYKVCDSIIELDINARIRQTATGEDSTGEKDSGGYVKEKADDLSRKSDE